MPLRIFLLLLLALPVLDIWSLGWVIDVAGLGPTLLGILLAGLVGFSTARLGAGLMFRQLAGMESAGDLLREGVLLLVAAGLLVFPGVVSDAVALPLLVGPVRRWLAPRVLSRLAIQSIPGGVGMGMPPGGYPNGDVFGNTSGNARSHGRVKVGESPPSSASRPAEAKPAPSPRRPNPFSTPFD